MTIKRKSSPITSIVLLVLFVILVVNLDTISQVYLKKESRFQKIECKAEKPSGKLRNETVGQSKVGKIKEDDNIVDEKTKNTNKDIVQLLVEPKGKNMISKK